ncbi:MAG: FAD-binding protein [Ferruginibacter sp.]
MEGHLTNWSGNLTYGTSNILYPETVAAVQSIVQQSTRIKALGSKHSFNDIADSREKLISLERLNHIVSLDKTANTVTVEAGMRYGELAPYLHKNGYALHNLASLPHITIAGAIATATHGSGMMNGNLSTGVSAIEFVNASGDLITLSKNNNDEQFYGAVVALGAIGILTKITLDLLPAFDMQQLVYLNLPMKELGQNFNTIASAGYSVSLFTNWKNQLINEVWIKNIVTPAHASLPIPDLFGAVAATKNMHPLENESAENCTEQMGIRGPWFDRLPHFKMGFKPSAGEELQSEYFVDIAYAYDAIMAVEKLQEKISPHLFVSEIRTIAADQLWMSPCYNQTCVAIHTTWKREQETVMKLLPLMEAQLEPFKPTPHWGKLFTMPSHLIQSRYSQLPDFKELVDAYDPAGKFRNDYLTSHLYTS